METSGKSSQQLKKTMCISEKSEKDVFDCLLVYDLVCNLMHVNNTGVYFRTKSVIFYDSRLQLKNDFANFQDLHGVSLEMLNFDDNVLASHSANNYIQSYSFLIPKPFIFDSSDFKETSMIVSTLVEFKAEWAKPFDSSLSDQYILRQRGTFFYTDIERLNASVLELPYVGDFKMLVIQPHEGVTLKHVTTELALNDLGEIYNELHSDGSQEIDIELRKFSLTSSLILNKAFKSMGVIDVFSPDDADLSLDNDLYIMNFEQRVTVTVSETGTTATAYTPGNVAKFTGRNNKKSKPFIFLIVSGPSLAIFFCGKYGQ
ncbi:unnamed protein product [Danaus chrysippus]|uniref:(African queen) hypothetical protein n=1 Tax=Danaus chrysippus TaxID=151541 RepID=A0A8J2VTX2_9NEOP|nr:unnamed protein product [Danaus chrysippus]